MRRFASAYVAVVCGLGASSAWAQNVPPSAPEITEPREGRVINPADLHMETGIFIDANPGDAHACTDWEVWTVSPLQRVWATLCIGGIERLHTHLGDGVFEGSHAGRRTLLPETSFTLRVRHKDSSGDVATQWGAWSERAFVTGAASAQFPLELEDVLALPTPQLLDSTGGNHTLANGVRVRLVTASNQLLLELRGRVGIGNLITNPAALMEHEAVRVELTAGTEAVSLPDLDLSITEHIGERTELYLPATTLAANATALFWVAANGATYFATPGASVPEFATLARGPAVAWTTAPEFRAEIVATGFQLPVSIAFVPNPGSQPDSPLYYVAELYGQIKVVARNGVVSEYASGLLNFNPTGNFPGSGEQGLACIAVHPTTGDLYITVMYAQIPGNEASPHHPAVERLTSTDGGRTMATRTRILNMAPEVQGQSHQISNITFGPDNFLYVHVGDGFDAASAQNLTQFRGKILRMTTAGLPVATNPFYNAADGITATDYVFARGVRNPFGGAWRQSDLSHYMVENGPSVDRFSKLTAGFNYGYTGSDQSMTIGAIYNWNPATAPVNITFLQNETFAGSGFPSTHWGRAYVTQSGGTYAIGPGNNSYKSITEWQISQAGAIVAGPRAVAHYNGGGASSAVAIAAGPDGLYFSDFYKEDSLDNPIARGSSILRLRYVAPPPPPDCNGNGVPDSQDLTAGTSQDCNGNAVPDECDIASGQSSDCNINAIPDECDTTELLTVNFNNGQSTPFVLNGSAVVASGEVRLTSTAANLIGTAIRPPLSTLPMTKFTAIFDLRIGAGSGADGMSFAAFDAARFNTNTLFSEEGPGSLNHVQPTGTGMLTVQFDTYDNGGGEGENTIEVMHNGVTLGRYTPPFDLEDNVTRRVRVDFDSGMISVHLTNAQGTVYTAFDELMVPAYQPFVALFGFGARTGGLTNEHVVDNVSFAVSGPGDVNGDGVPDECDCPADFNRDGGVDGSDIEAFIVRWEGGRPEADVNRDGGIDGADIGTFFVAWEAGGCF